MEAICSTGIQDSDDLDLQEESHRVDGGARKDVVETVISESISKKHWLWDSWILLSMIAMLSFTICNFFISEISDLGVTGLLYFCPGSLIFSICYFTYNKEWAKRNPACRGIIDSTVSESRYRKVLLLTWEENKFDWWALFIVFCGAAFQTAIFFSITLTYTLAHKATLNVGIAQTVWSINPFFVSICERVFFNTPFNFAQVTGMLLMVLCAICISLSGLFGP